MKATIYDISKVFAFAATITLPAIWASVAQAAPFVGSCY